MLEASQIAKVLILQGKLPPLPQEIYESDDPAIKALIQARDKALTYDASKRPSARDVARMLDKTASRSDTEQIVKAPSPENAALIGDDWECPALEWPAVWEVTPKGSSRTSAICACAKCGPTSFYSKLYEIAIGKHWDYTDEPVSVCARA